MRLGFISTFLPQRCGIATYTNYLAGTLRKVFPELHIKILAENEAYTKNLENLEVRPCWDRNYDFTDAISSHMDGLDVVHLQHEFSIHSSLDRLKSLFAACPDGIRKVVTLHTILPSHFEPKGKEGERIVRALVDWADKVIVHQKCQRLILQRMGVPEDKVELIPHGTEITRRDKVEARRRLKLPESAKIMLMFGFIKHTKNIHLVVASLKKIAVEVPDVYLFIAGGLAPDAPQEDQDYLYLIRKKINELGPFKEHVLFAGYFFPHQDMPDLLASADVILFPYCNEERSASGAFHLALGAGKPVVAYRIPKFEELSEICDDLLVLPNNKHGLKRAIIRVLTDDEFRNFAISRIEQYAQRTSWENIAREHMRVYESLL